MLPFHLLTSLGADLKAVLSVPTHRELEVFWKKCGIPSEVLRPYYGPWPPAPSGYYYPRPSKKKIIEGVLEALDKRGLLGNLVAVLDEAVAYGRGLEGAELQEAIVRLESSRRRIQGREVGVGHKDRPIKGRCPDLEESAPRSLQELHLEFLQLLSEKDCQRRGYRFEALLNDLFEANGLRPRGSFRILGEQIDGAFELDNRHFVIEARWREEPANASDVYVLRSKVEGRPEATTLGLFISLNGFTPDTSQALVHGKRPNVLLTDGEVLCGILEGRWPLCDALRAMVREASQTGNPYLRARDMTV